MRRFQTTIYRLYSFASRLFPRNEPKSYPSIHYRGIANLPPCSRSKIIPQEIPRQTCWSSPHSVLLVCFTASSRVLRAYTGGSASAGTPSLAPHHRLPHPALLPSCIGPPRATILMASAAAHNSSLTVHLTCRPSTAAPLLLPVPGGTWMRTYPWIQMQYLIFACIAHTAVCAIHKYPKYPVSAILPKCKYPQYMQYMTYCMPISRPSVHNA